MAERRKYEFVPGDEITIAPGRTLKRIRALVAIEALGITPGDLGGYVEREANLAQVYGDARVFGNAWVSGDARVYGNAWVCGDAQVYGNARVCGDARVSGDARVCGDAQVYGDAWVSGDAQVYGDARVCGDARCLLTIGPVGSRNATLTVCPDAKLGVRYTTGCFSGSRDTFAAAVERDHGNSAHGHAYRAAIALADLLVDACPAPAEQTAAEAA